MNCRYVASDQPRVLKGKHTEECPGGDCGGCQPCTEPHCRVCAREHSEGTCTDCVGAAREDLHEIARLCAGLRSEARWAGVESEAMNLLGPAANPEAWGHVTTSVNVGRLPADYLGWCDRCKVPWPCEQHADGELHPLFVLTTWDMVWRDALEHDEPSETATIAGAVFYLDLQMTYMAGYEHAPFEDFARDLRRCVAHLERVLHDGEQIDRGVPCMGKRGDDDCGEPLRRVWEGWTMPWSQTERAREDGWACPRCRRWHTEDQYRFAVQHLHRAEAEWLTDRDMQERTGVKATTIRSWGREDGPVRRRRDSERTVYSVEDVLSVAKSKGILAA